MTPSIVKYEILCRLYSFVIYRDVKVQGNIAEAEPLEPPTSNPAKTESQTRMPAVNGHQPTWIQAHVFISYK